MDLCGAVVLVLAVLLPIFLKLNFNFIVIKFIDKKESTISGYLNKLLFYTNTLYRVKPLMQALTILLVDMANLPFLSLKKTICFK